jgi:hypothetical protein
VNTKNPRILNCFIFIRSALAIGFGRPSVFRHSDNFDNFFSAFLFFPAYWVSGFPAVPTFLLFQLSDGSGYSPVILVIENKRKRKGEALRLLLKKSSNNLALLSNLK